MMMQEERTKLYVGNINYATTEEGLRKAFAQAGGTVVDVKVITDKYSGRPRGFAFVEMGTPEEAQAAIEFMNGQNVDGRTIAVSEARERGNDSRPGGGGGRRPQGNNFRPRGQMDGGAPYNSRGPRQNQRRGGGGGYRSSDAPYASFGPDED
jgi:RNA recognition motif-containing protein